mmetsp:Transcript_61619/g.194990  ORF Transcript_61619/g.194990 Transcript_61619/m.194990 type:complete len:214 (+) Transcript_61619:532-1173(+)
MVVRSRGGDAVEQLLGGGAEHAPLGVVGSPREVSEEAEGGVGAQPFLVLLEVLEVFWVPQLAPLGQLVHLERDGHLGLHGGLVVDLLEVQSRARARDLQPQRLLIPGVDAEVPVQQRVEREVHGVEREHREGGVGVRVPPHLVHRGVIDGEELDEAEPRGIGDVDELEQVQELAAPDALLAAQGEDGRGEPGPAPERVVPEVPIAANHHGGWA